MLATPPGPKSLAIHHVYKSTVSILIKIRSLQILERIKGQKIKGKMCPTKHRQQQHHHHSHRSATAVAAADGSEAEDWRHEAINGGSLKHVDLNNGSNGWASPPGDLFSLRGPHYFIKKTKIPSGNWLLQSAGVDWLRSHSKLDHILARSDNRVVNSLKSSNLQGKNKKTSLIAVNLQVPGRDHHSAVFYFVTKDDEGLQPGSLLYRFVHGDDNFRNSRFKIVNRIVKGPWIVKAAVGNYAACLLGKALKCNYYVGENYLEIDVDIGSSAIASAILHLALGYVTAVTIDMGFLVEAQSEEELPEKLFGAVRVCQMEMSSAAYIDNSGLHTVSFNKGVHNGHLSNCNSGSKNKVLDEESSESGMD